MRDEGQERDRRFNALFEAYGADIVAYCAGGPDPLRELPAQP